MNMEKTIMQRAIPKIVGEPAWLVDYRKANAQIVVDVPLKEHKYAKLALWNEQLESFTQGKSQTARPQELEIHGVKVLSWNQAIEQYPAELKEALLGEDKARDQFQAFVNAYFTDGFVLVFPNKDGTTVEWNTHALAGTLQKNVILIPKNVQNVSLIEHVDAPAPFAAMNTTLLAQEGSLAHWARIHQYAESNQTLMHQFVVAKKDTQVKCGNIWISGDTTRSHAMIHLQSKGSSVEYREVLVGKGHAHWDANTMSLHAAENAFSHVISKTILFDESKSVFDGMIKVKKDAQQTNALLECHSMLLSQQAGSNNIPGLEIEADDVKCTHKATLAHIEPEELFYLQARGLPQKMAEKMIASGFLEANLSIFPPTMSNALMKAIDAALE